MNKFLNKEQLFKNSILAFGLYPIIPDKLKGFLVFFLLLSSLISFLIVKEKKKFDVKLFMLNASFYIISAITLLYTTDIGKGIKSLSETQLSSLLIPLAFFLASPSIIKSEGLLKKFKSIFVKSTMLFSAFYVVFLFFKPIAHNPHFDFPSVFFFRNGMIEMPLIGIEPIYGSIYLSISFILVFNELVKTRKVNALKLVFGLIFLSIVILSSSKMALLSTLFISVLIIVKNLKLSIKQKTIGFLCLVLFLVTLYNIPTIKQRTQELFNKETYTEYRRHNSTSIRLTILRSSFEIANENFLFGVGIGDVKNELVKKYKDISYDLVERRYNTHNQYLSILIGTGFFGLMVFLLFLAYNLKASIMNNESLFLIIVFFLLNFMSENILERQNGIILFYFIIGLNTLKIPYQNKERLN